MAKPSANNNEASPKAIVRNLGARLQGARLLRGYLQAVEIDRLLDLREGTWSGYEKGKSRPKEPLLLKFADILDVSLDALFGRHDDFSHLSSSELRRPSFRRVANQSLAVVSPLLEDQSKSTEMGSYHEQSTKLHGDRE